MKLLDCLLEQDIRELRHLASFYHCECNRHSKLELVQSIHFQLLHQQTCRSALQELGEELMSFVLFLAFQPKRTFALEELMTKGRLVQVVAGAKGKPEQWLAQLIKRGWLFVIRHACHQQVEIPADVHQLLRQLLAEKLLRKVQPVEEKLLTQRKEFKIRDEQQAIVEDLYRFLRFVASGRVPLTKAGVIHKRYQLQLFHSLAIPEDPLPKQRWRFGYGRRFPFYPNRFALIYDFCYAKGWIREQAGVLSLTLKGESQLADEPDEDDLRSQLTRFWLILYQQPIPALPFLYELLTTSLNGHWIERGRVTSFLSQWLRAYYFDDVATLANERILGMMAHMGLLAILTDEASGEQYVKIK
ncbi:hypothetical protein GCM10010965_16900 [Caldalkalibacillus thermarum]|uniref:hypothetical protein n=1 Tax=Caldalkalibacillus thermarum TaxID=296745 RepID=UPI00166C905D|nr:hypothetical protein [Caldalkalibacillus thermarum]GGK24753.1 hypothetical protein GCM10010965_16900 [Caldalkalibacillus thermarum]